MKCGMSAHEEELVELAYEVCRKTCLLKTRGTGKFYIKDVH